MSDLHSIRDESKRTLKALKKVGLDPSALDDNEHCLRGLEDLQRNGSVPDKKMRTRDLIQGVLEEQCNQRQMGITDPKGLQVRASACSKQARHRALLAGQNDEKEALAIFMESNVGDHSSWNNSNSSVDSKDVSDEESRLGCIHSFGRKMALQPQQKNTSSARSA